ncbi:PQQ-dependent sugar dehydrogenase [Rubrobacter tropicus]|uniref:PQQ-dependent sugar dehydrogenase n=1 Tax=Rubrobacter tropicus TaxID=2653851 RepID=A0A6G8QAN8_9ACTN|nr:PQQ-dependent sugar dehydrogenase [Rubrobacter tropicus]QIN83531.1 PQQ-dependent sugar dehydrogenase [Rubrobacter tropicus]
MRDTGYVGGFRGAVLMSVAALTIACAGCGVPTGDSGAEGQDPRPIDTGQTEDTENTASGTTPGPETTGEVRPASTRVEVGTLATGLRVPWSFAFLPDGDALVTERDSGRLLRVSPSGDVREIQTLPEGGDGEGGLLGVAVSPEYERDRYVYAYTTTETDNRVVRFRIGEEPEPILTGIPVNSYHNGGRIEFGPDDKLYVTTGDAGDTSNSQDQSSLGGKILRVNPDGSVPGDNPFPGSPVYSYGHRNVQGLAWDADGQLFASEFGQDTWDEANRIEAGDNYGWPEVEGEGGEDRGFVDPITVWPTSEASPSGAEILVDGAIPQWEGDLFVTALRGESLWRLELDDRGNVTGRERLLDGEVGRVRDVAQAPDGSLWVSTSNHDSYGNPVSEDDDRIFRLAPDRG